MRLRNIKNKEEILNNSKYIILNPKEYKGKWNNVFKNNNPIYIEIGMGKGKFILENALKYPNINFIGIEKYDSVIARAIKKIDEREINNLKLIDEQIKNYIREKLISAKEKGYIEFKDLEITTFLVYKMYIALIVEWDNQSQNLDEQMIANSISEILKNGLRKEA